MDSSDDDDDDDDDNDDDVDDDDDINDDNYDDGGDRDNMNDGNRRPMDEDDENGNGSGAGPSEHSSKRKSGKIDIEALSEEDMEGTKKGSDFFFFLLCFSFSDVFSSSSFFFYYKKCMYFFFPNHAAPDDGDEDSEEEVSEGDDGVFLPRLIPSDSALSEANTLLQTLFSDRAQRQNCGLFLQKLFTSIMQGLQSRPPFPPTIPDPSQLEEWKTVFADVVRSSGVKLAEWLNAWCTHMLTK